MIDGHKDIAGIIQLLAETHTPDDVLRLLSKLHDAELIQWLGQDFDSQRATQARRNQAHDNPLAAIKNPLAIKIPLLDPDRWLNSLLPVCNRFNHKLVIFLAVLSGIIGALIALRNFPELAVYTASRADSLSSLLLVALVYPVIKTIHEFAHALAIKRYGGEVHEMGIMLLVFFPVPYIDASASASFPQKGQRIAVAAAGILAELIIAAFAMIVWANVQAGLLSDLAIACALIGGLSTLVFNGNPLLRFDGYFVLSDALEIPNLASRSRAYCLFLLKRALGIKNLLTPMTACGEKPWLIGYFPVSGAYRFIVLFTICVFLITTLPLIGALLAGIALFKHFVVPLCQIGKYLCTDAELVGQRGTSLAMFTGVVVAATAVIAFLPMPNSNALPGVVRMPETATLRALESGFVTQLHFSDNAQLKQNDVIATIQNDKLAKDKARLEWRLKELAAQRAKVVLESPTEAQQIATSIAATQNQLKDIETRLDKLIIRAPAAGHIQFASDNEWVGQYIEEGEDFAYIVNGGHRTIIAAAPESMIADIRDPDTQVFIRSVYASTQTIEAKISKLTPASTNKLSSSALGSKYGGAVMVDSRDTDGKQSLEKVFHLELTPLDEHYLLSGTTVMLRFEHPPASIGAQLKDAITRLLMREISW